MENFTLEVQSIETEDKSLIVIFNVLLNNVKVGEARIDNQKMYQGLVEKQTTLIRNTMNHTLGNLVDFCNLLVG